MELIDARQLRAFQLLAQTGSFTLAAKQMFVTQSAVSHSIKALERSLDCKLLDRSGKQVALTAEGEALLRHADRILDEMRSASEELKTLSRWGYGRLRIGATDTMCQYLLPAVLREFRESFPNCEVAINAADTADILNRLDRGIIDVALGMQLPNPEPGVDFELLFEDHLVFAVSPLHPWATGEQDPSETLTDQRFIIYARQSPTFQLVERHLHKLNVPSPRYTELGNMEAIKELSKIGMGVGVVAPWTIREDLNKGLLVRIEPPGEPVRRQWGIFSRGRTKKAEQGMTTQTFTGICATVARNLSIDPPASGQASATR